ncbi:Pectinesterase inhibitor domain [Dillenia turbinata]|uniref:Pectinesterase inhibitor domain n=1 Tax=Dillenia turbinata TaxID=194707 RepID=A0AAN8U7F6_9MAGN
MVTCSNIDSSRICDYVQYKSLCKATIEPLIRQSKEANLKDLAELALKVASSNASAVMLHINHLLDETTDTYVSQCLSECMEDYQDAMYQIEDSLGALDSRGYDDIKTWLTTAIDNIDSCEKEFNFHPLRINILTTINRTFMQLCNNALVITNLLAKTTK